MRQWDPFRDLLTIQDRMNKLFESVLIGPAALGEMESAGVWRPVAEVFEDTDALVVECELAGVESDDVKVSVEGEQLLVEGQRQRSGESESWNWLQMERAPGKFMRRFELPTRELELGAIRAELHEGVLVVRIPWKERPPSRSISIETPGSHEH